MKSETAIKILRNLSLSKAITADEFNALQQAIKALRPTKSIDIVKAYCDGLSQAWILTKDKMPPPFTSVLITIKQKYEWETEWQYDTDLALWDSGKNVWEVTNDWDEGQGFEIIAWKPMPEPYKEGE